MLSKSLRMDWNIDAQSCNFCNSELMKFIHLFNNKKPRA